MTSNFHLFLNWCQIYDYMWANRESKPSVGWLNFRKICQNLAPKVFLGDILCMKYNPKKPGEQDLAEFPKSVCFESRFFPKGTSD